MTSEPGRDVDAGAFGRATLHALPDAVLVVTGTGRPYFLNHAAERLLGCGRADLPADVIRLVAVTSHDLWRAAWHDAASTAVTPVELEVLDAAGRARICDVSLVPSGDDMVVVLRDATARREADERTSRMLSDMDEHRARVEAQAADFVAQAEALHVSQQHLSLILASTRDATWDWDLTTGVVDFNATFATALGLGPGTAEPIDHFLQRIHVSDRAAVTLAMADVAAQRAVNVSLGEFRLRYDDGHVRWILARGQVVAVDERGRARRAVGMLSDINDRKVRDEERQRLQRLEAVGGLAAGVAHEINTPLQLVGDNLAFLADNLHAVIRLLDGIDRARSDVAAREHWQRLTGHAVTPELEEDLAYARHEFPDAIRESIDGIERVSRIVRALKEFAHPGHSERERVDIRRVIDNAVTLTRNQWRFVADLVMEFGPLPDALLCSQGECTQLLVNLIINAAQALGETRGEVRGRIVVRAHATDAHCTIEVEDSGPGIPPELQSRIFDPFFTTKAVGQGTGQGLALVRTIAQRHGGVVTFESVVGQGTTFTVRLPLTGSASEATAAA